MVIKFNIYFAWFLVSFFLVGCASSNIKSGSKELSKNQETIDKKISEEQLFAFKFNFFEGNKFMMLGDYESALSCFKSCLIIDSSSSATYYKLAAIYFDRKDNVLAEKNAEKAVLYSPNSVWYLYLLGSLYNVNGKYQNAIDVYKKLIQISPNEMEYYLNLSDTYLQAKDYDNSIKVYNQIEKLFGISEQISLQKHTIYISLGKKKEALQELLNLSAYFDYDPKYQRLVADFYFKIGNVDKSMEIFSSLILVNANDGFSHFGLADCYRSTGKSDLVIKELKSGFTSTEVPSDVKISVLVNFIKNVGDNKDMQIVAYELTEILIKMYPDDADINSIYANFLLQNKLVIEAKQCLDRVLKVRKDKFEIWQQIILIDNDLRDFESMFSHSNEALIYFPNQSFLYFFNGFSAFQLNNYIQAMNSFEFGYKLTTKDDPLKINFLTFLGEAYFKNGFRDKGYKCFEELIVVEPDNLMVLNNYSYYLSVDKINLEKAEQMSKKTIVKEPNNATYLDTYAWILFQLKRYPEALQYIIQAVTNNKEANDVILEHYGDILFFNNKVDDAIVQWELALTIGKGSGLLDNKISNRKYIE